MKCSCGLQYTVTILKDESKMIKCNNCYENSWEAKRNREMKEIKEWIVQSLDEVKGNKCNI